MQNKKPSIIWPIVWAICLVGRMFTGATSTAMFFWFCVTAFSIFVYGYWQTIGAVPSNPWKTSRLVRASDD